METTILSEDVDCLETHVDPIRNDEGSIESGIVGSSVDPDVISTIHQIRYSLNNYDKLSEAYWRGEYEP